MSATRELGRGLVALGGALVIFGCQGPSPTQVPPTASAKDHAAEARDAVKRRDWTAAVPLLREAIRRQPDNLDLHYQLGLSASYVDAVDEATREFEWVAHSAPESPEGQAAASWLAERTDGASGSVRESGSMAFPRAVSGEASVHGRVTWSEGRGPAVPRNRFQLQLVGLPDGPTRDHRFSVRTDEHGRFEFTRVPAGSYRLTDRIAGTPQWRLRVEVERGQDLTVDLSPANSLKTRDDFPGVAR